MIGILGRNDEFLRLIDASFDATVMARGNKIIFSGSEEENQKLEQLFKELLFLYRQGLPVTSHDVRYSIYMVQGGAVAKLHNMYAETLIVTWRGHQIKAKTLGQWNYVRAIKNNFITFTASPFVCYLSPSEGLLRFCRTITFPYFAASPSTMVTLRITTGTTGLSLESVLVCPIFCTTSIPSLTRPNTA